MDGVDVGAEPAQEAQEDQGEEEEEQGDRHCGVGDDLQGENIAVLWRAVRHQVRNQQEGKEQKQEAWLKLERHVFGNTSLLEMSMSTAKLVMWLH